MRSDFSLNNKKELLFIVEIYCRSVLYCFLIDTPCFCWCPCMVINELVQYLSDPM